MFEKEAEEYGNSFEWTNDDRVIDYSKQGFQKGAEFGYNKANEWHYPSKGEYPEENKIVLIYAKNEEGYGHDFMTYHKDNGWYGYGSYCKEVIAWQELNTPKEIE